MRENSPQGFSYWDVVLIRARRWLGIVVLEISVVHFGIFDRGFSVLCLGSLVFPAFPKAALP